MRFDRPHKRRLLPTSIASAVVACAAIGAVVATDASSSAAKSAKAASSTSPATHVAGGTLLAGTLPSQGTPKQGGTLTVGQITGQTPSYIFPLIPGAPCSAQTFNFVADQYLPLYYGPDGARPAVNESLSAAETPVWSNGDKTVKITIKPGLKWSDGTPITGEDVVFFFDLLKASLNTKLGGSPANWCQYASQTQFPYNVKSISASGATVTLNLTGAVNPTWFLLNQLQDTNGGVYPLPSKAWDTDGTEKITDWATNPADAYKIYAYLNKQGADVSTFASSPLWKVVDGPFKLTGFSATTNAFTMIPNPGYGLKPKPSISELSVETFTSSTAMLNSLESGALDIGNIDASTELGSISTLQNKGYDVFGGPTWGWFGGFINFKDTANDFNKIVAQPYMRGVFAELVPQQAIIESVYHGWRLQPTAGAAVPVLALRLQERQQGSVAIQPAQGRQDPEGSWLGRAARWQDHLCQARHCRQRVRRRHPQGHPDQVRLGQRPDLGERGRHPGVGGLRRRGKAGRGHRRVVPEQELQHPDFALRRPEPGRQEVHERLGSQQLRWNRGRLLPDAERLHEHYGRAEHGRLQRSDRQQADGGVARLTEREGRSRTRSPTSARATRSSTCPTATTSSRSTRRSAVPPTRSQR